MGHLFFKDDSCCCVLAVGEPVFQRNSQLHKQKWGLPSDEHVSYVRKPVLIMLVRKRKQVTHQTPK